MRCCCLFMPGQLVGTGIQETWTCNRLMIWLQKNYPVIKQKDLIRQTAAINIENLQKGFLPQLTLSGQATYQSDVTKY